MAGFNAESAKLEIAVVVLKERERAGLTQRELAERAGVLQSTIARIEHGHNTSFDTMSKIAFALGKNLRLSLRELCKILRCWSNNTQNILVQFVMLC